MKFDFEFLGDLLIAYPLVHSFDEWDENES